MMFLRSDDGEACGDVEPSGGEAFASRHLGPDAGDVAAMLEVLGAESLDALIDAAVPETIRDRSSLALPPAGSVAEMLAELRALASQNRVLTSLVGLGYADTVTPGVIQRNVLENPAWYTAYTPYQPEISQGRLEVLLNFQTMVTDLTGTEVANASLLDEPTAAAEAMALCHRVNGAAGSVFFVDADTHPQTIAVVQTRAEPLGIGVVVGDADGDIPATGVFGVLLQYPGSSGALVDPRSRVEALHERGVLVAVATDLLACVLVTPPGEWGADVVVGSAQRFGVPLGFGGPHAGFMATRDELIRNLPGRLVGVSLDAAGRPALRLALQTREQHIRREKATSNICTAQVLLSVISALYAMYHGPAGLRRIASGVHRLASVLAEGLRRGGVQVRTPAYFDTIAVEVPGRASVVAHAARERGINLREVDDDTLVIALDETTTRETVAAVWDAFGIPDHAPDDAAPDGIPPALRRTTDFLTHPVFTRYHSETEMLRYLRRMADRDLALDRTMIPLGSCTMKLNATAEMVPITWPEFSRLHPFAPIDQAAGYRRLFGDLESWLAEITGYDAVSLQPNAGSQGEFAGLLAIRAYHRANGEAHRDVCLIPASAHGTNAASAAMSGMRVVVVTCDADGNVDLEDLRDKAARHADELSALMVTYPSTHGVYEEHIREVCDVVHACDGQVYLDGANLNALVGLARPGWLGADVSHLNLHKTFCIPHGGGGPGMGPIGVRAHLAPYLPNHPLQPAAGPPSGIGPISGAPWGSAGILPIAWAYIRMMGEHGLRRASEIAVLSANYVARRLAAHYPVLYAGPHGLVAHECILDLRPLTASTGVTAEDVAKRLIDFGFHAPTMSFPVAGTLMVEPTESEGQRELDRFCDAMIAIRAEIAAVERGEWAVADSPLRHAPHPAEDVTVDDWNRAYPRRLGANPGGGAMADKYFPPVSRIDQAFGDRNLVCACPPVEAYAETT
jgi:glycine dehydrogenase